MYWLYGFPFGHNRVELNGAVGGAVLAFAILIIISMFK